MVALAFEGIRNVNIMHILQSFAFESGASRDCVHQYKLGILIHLPEVIKDKSPNLQRRRDGVENTHEANLRHEGRNDEMDHEFGPAPLFICLW